MKMKNLAVVCVILLLLSMPLAFAINQPPVANFDWAPAVPIPNNPVAFDASASMDPDGTIVFYTWEFGDGATGLGVGPVHTYTAEGDYTVKLTVMDNGNATASVSKTVPVRNVHDIAITDVKASPTNVIVGNPVSIKVDILNEGTVDETFDLNLYCDTTLIDTVSVTLSSEASTTLTFNWDTASVSPRTYTIRAEVPPVTGETHIADNEFINGKVTITPVPVYVDIKPGSWPNPINVGSKGVFAIAICGTEDFDVRTIDPITVKLYVAGLAQGVSPIRWSYEDVATPYIGSPGGGHTLKADGYLDIVFLFDVQTVVTKLGLAGHVGETIPLIIKGNLNPAPGGLPIQGQDYVWILEKARKR